MKVKVKKLHPLAQLPSSGSPLAAASDLYACLDAPLTVIAGQRVKIPTGIAIEYECTDAAAVICARSGLSAKHGIALANGIGVVDPDYRGELLVSVVNLSDRDYTVSPGERIAQLMFLPILRAEFEEAYALTETARGEGGFGSTGAK